MTTPVKYHSFPISPHGTRDIGRFEVYQGLIIARSFALNLEKIAVSSG
jgi:hypothetical protein